MKRRSHIPGVHGGGRLGPPETDGRYAVAGNEPESTRRSYCNHTGSDYWPRPCDACLLKSEQAMHRATS